MSLGHGARIVRAGLVFHLDAFNLAKHGVSPYKNLANTGTTITNTDFTVVDNIFRSNADPVLGTGTSEFSFSGLSITTGSVTVQWFMKITSEPNVDANNNWRRLIANNAGGRIPFGFVLEQGRQINFTLDTTTGNKRYIDGQFTPVTAGLNVWEMYTYTYDKDTGVAAIYKDKTLVRTGPQTGASDGSLATVAGEAMNDLTTGTVMEISNSSTVSTNGDGCLPCDLGPWLIYNKALSADEIEQNFNVYRGRFGI